MQEGRAHAPRVAAAAAELHRCNVPWRAAVQLAAPEVAAPGASKAWGRVEAATEQASWQGNLGRGGACCCLMACMCLVLESIDEPPVPRCKPASHMGCFDESCWNCALSCAEWVWEFMA
jgi:hypothetical protein